MVKSLDELDAFNLAHQFKLEVYRLLRDHPEVKQDAKFWFQLRDAVRGVERNVAEGWRRYYARDMAQFLRIANASNEESLVAIRDGIDCEYFTETESVKAFELGRRSGAAIMALIKSLEDLPPRPPARNRKNPRRPKHP